jgi:hypothetical protein
LELRREIEKDPDFRAHDLLGAAKLIEQLEHKDDPSFRWKVP